MDSTDKRDLFEERAAIYEFEAGLSRKEAESKAWNDVYVNPAASSRGIPPAAASGCQ